MVQSIRVMCVGIYKLISVGMEHHDFSRLIKFDSTLCGLRLNWTDYEYSNCCVDFKMIFVDHSNTNIHFEWWISEIITSNQGARIFVINCIATISKIFSIRKKWRWSWNNKTVIFQLNLFYVHYSWVTHNANNLPCTTCIPGRHNLLCSCRILFDLSISTR